MFKSETTFEKFLKIVPIFLLSEICFSASLRIIFSPFEAIFSHLSNRTHRTKINESFSERSRMEHDVPQVSILGPLLFNIDLIDLFHECEGSNIASYAD